jgi:hypothetical protein
MSKNDELKREGAQSGAQQHAEGQHGDATRRHLEQERNSAGVDDAPGGPRAAHDPNVHGKKTGKAAEAHEQDMAGAEHDGSHRLFEGREQHDEADKNSDKNRLIKDVGKHHHDPNQFQIPGGREADGPDGVVRSPRQGGK